MIEYAWKCCKTEILAVLCESQPKKHSHPQNNVFLCRRRAMAQSSRLRFKKVSCGEMSRVRPSSISLDITPSSPRIVRVLEGPRTAESSHGFNQLVIVADNYNCQRWPKCGQRLHTNTLSKALIHTAILHMTFRLGIPVGGTASP